MAAEVNWNGYYGIGKSNAQVLQGNPALDELKKRYATQQNEKRMEDAQFAQNLAKLNFKGAKDSDFGELNKQFADVLNTHAALRSANNPQQRQQLQLQLQQKQQGLLYDINSSVQNNQQEQKLADLRLNPNANLSDDYYKNVTDIQKTPSIGSSHNDYQTKYQQATSGLFDKPYDLGKETGDIGKRFISDIAQNDKLLPASNGGKLIEHTKGKQFDAEAYSKGVVDKALNDRNYMKAVIKATGIQEPDAAIQQYIKLTTPAFQKQAQEFKTYGGEIDKPDDWYDKYNYALEHPKGSTTNDPTYFQDLSERMRTGVKGSGEEFSNQLSQNPDYLKGLLIDNKNPKEVKIVVPAKYKFSQKDYDTYMKDKPDGDKINPNAGRTLVKPAYIVKLDSTDPQQWTAGFSRLYKDVTGDNTASASKALTQYGKGKVVNGKSQYTQPKNNKDPLGLF